jgi:hypothetical protein
MSIGELTLRPTYLTRQEKELKAALQLANAQTEDRWVCWGYQRDIDTLVLTTYSSGSEVTYLIFRQPSYVRLLKMRFPETASFRSGWEHAEGLCLPDSLSRDARHELIVIRAAGFDYCVVCYSVEYYRFSEKRDD